MNDAIPAMTGTRVVAVVLDPGAVDVPGVVLGLQPGAATHQLRVRVRHARGTFHTETFEFPATTQVPATVCHTHLSLPGTRLRQAWTDLAMGDLLDIAAGLRGPQDGDAVRLTTPWPGAHPGDIAVLHGVVGQLLPIATITLPADVAGPAHHTRVTGLPAPLPVPLRELTTTGQPVSWPRATVPECTAGEADTITVPLWDWTPGLPS